MIRIHVHDQGGREIRTFDPIGDQGAQGSQGTQGSAAGGRPRSKPVTPKPAVLKAGGFTLDFGTSEGARKAAQTRSGGGGSKEQYHTQRGEHFQRQGNQEAAGAHFRAAVAHRRARIHPQNRGYAQTAQRHSHEAEGWGDRGIRDYGTSEGARKAAEQRGQGTWGKPQKQPTREEHEKTLRQAGARTLAEQQRANPFQSRQRDQAAQPKALAPPKAAAPKAPTTPKPPSAPKPQGPPKPPVAGQQTPVRSGLKTATGVVKGITGAIERADELGHLNDTHDAGTSIGGRRGHATRRHVMAEDEQRKRQRNSFFPGR